MFAASVQAWARAEAVVRLLWQWLEERDVMAGLTAAATTTEEETQSGGKTSRKSVTRTVASVIDTLRRYEVHAANLRSTRRRCRHGQRDAGSRGHHPRPQPQEPAIAERRPQEPQHGGGEQEHHGQGDDPQHRHADRLAKDDGVEPRLGRHDQADEREDKQQGFTAHLRRGCPPRTAQRDESAAAPGTAR